MRKKKYNGYPGLLCAVTKYKNIKTSSWRVESNEFEDGADGADGADGPYRAPFSCCSRRKIDSERKKKEEKLKQR